MTDSTDKRTARFISLPFREMQIRAWEKTGSGFKESIFPVSSVERLRAIDGASCAMVLKSGFEIPVLMTADDLYQKIYASSFRAGPVLDLSEKTGGVFGPEPGERVAGQGIYLGVYTPKDRNGKSLSKTFNVFAAPEDLPETMKYVDAVKHIAKLKDWNGFDGTNYATDKELYAAIKSGSYNGGWIIPTRELLVGTEPDGESGVRKGKVIQPDNLFDHQNKGAFKGTFKTAASSGSDYPGWYWSSTENRDNPSHVWGVRFSDGDEGWDRKDNNLLSCRPVRLVEASVSVPAPG